jgi:putative two-component system response regulator
MKDLSECVVLIVDDTEANVDILVDALAEDYDIAVAMDGESALEIVADDKPDLILLDIMMPGLDGFEVCEKLKAGDETRDIAIMFLSGKTDLVDKEKAMAMGAVDFITKPIDVPDIQQRVKNYLLQNM